MPDDAKDLSRLATDRRAAAIERLGRILIALAGLVIVGLLLRELADVVLLVFTAILIAAVLRGAAERLGRTVGVSPGMALSAILLTLLAVVLLAGWLRGPALVAEAGRLGHQAHDQISSLRGQLAHVPWGNQIVTRAPAPTCRAPPTTWPA